MAPSYRLDPKRQYSIAIVGGGIGGLCTAIGLLHQGVAVEIYEGKSDHSTEVEFDLTYVVDSCAGVRRNRSRCLLRT